MMHNRALAPRRLDWMCLALFLALSLCACSKQGSAWSPDPDQLMRRVADRTIHDYPQPPDFNWGEGVMMAGMMHAGIALDEPKYIDFVRRWADHWASTGIGPLMASKGYCGHWGPGLPLLMLYEKTGNHSYRQMAQQIVDFIAAKAGHTSDGFPADVYDTRQIWVDTLFMCCPVYSHMAKANADPALIQAGAKLLDVCARHCQDSKTGLFYHVYDEKGARTIGPLWARGNGWVALSYVEILRKLDRKSGEYKLLSAQFSRLVQAILATQDRDTGLWHTIMDRPDTYLETSASAMLLCALVRARREGIISVDDYVLRRAWAGVSSKVDAQGHVIDVSAGTSARPDPAWYAKRPLGTFTWGTGAFLMAAAELKR